MTITPQISHCTHAYRKDTILLISPFFILSCGGGGGGGGGSSTTTGENNASTTSINTTTFTTSTLVGGVEPAASPISDTGLVFGSPEYNALFEQDEDELLTEAEIEAKYGVKLNDGCTRPYSCRPDFLYTKSETIRERANKLRIIGEENVILLAFDYDNLSEEDKVKLRFKKHVYEYLKSSNLSYDFKILENPDDVCAIRLRNCTTIAINAIREDLKNAKEEILNLEKISDISNRSRSIFQVVPYNSIRQLESNNAMNSWHIEYLNLHELHDSITNGEFDITPPSVMILESSFHQEHIDIANPQLTFSAFSPELDEPYYKRHGTAILGALSGALQDDIGTTSIAPGVTTHLYSITHNDDETDKQIDKLEAYIEDNNINIVNISLGLSGWNDHTSLHNFFYNRSAYNINTHYEEIQPWKKFFQKHPQTLFIVSAGNSGVDAYFNNGMIHYEKRDGVDVITQRSDLELNKLDNVIIVGALRESTNSESPTLELDFGESVDILAPHGFTVPTCKTGNLRWTQESIDFLNDKPVDTDIKSKLMELKGTIFTDADEVGNTIKDIKFDEDELINKEKINAAYRLFLLAVAPDGATCDVLVNGSPYYEILSGTSFSAPVVSAAAALLYAKNPNLTPAQLKFFLIYYSDIPDEPDIGEWKHPRLNINKIIQNADKIPYISNLSPDNVSHVPINQSFFISFSQRMETNITSQSITLTPSVEGLFYDWISLNTISLNLSNENIFSYDTRYSLNIRGVPVPLSSSLYVQTSEGIPLGENIEVFFTTEPKPDTPPTDVSIIIEGGIGVTTSHEVMLKIEAKDDNNLSAYLLSEDILEPEKSNANWVNVENGGSPFAKNTHFPLSTQSYGEKTVYVWFKDDAGQVSSPASDNIFYDDYPQNMSLEFRDTQPVTDREITLYLHGKDSAGTLTHYYISELPYRPLSNDSNWLPLLESINEYTGTGAYTLMRGSGTKTIYSWFKDNNNNVSQDTVSVDIEFNDNENPPPADSSPNNLSVNINDGATSTLNRSVSITLQASDDNGLIAYYLSENSDQPSITANGWVTISSTTNYNSSVSFTLSSGNGQKTVYSWFKDTSNQISSRRSNNITLNEPPANSSPNNLSVNINDGATSTLNRTVSVTLQASDDNGLNAYYLSENSDQPSITANGWITISSTTSYDSSVSFTLSNGNGQKTVYSWFKDTNNQISSSRSDTIILNEPPVDSIPSNNYIGIQGNGLKTERDIRIRIRAIDDNGLVAYILSEDSTSPTSDSPQWIEIDGSSADFNQIVDFTITSNGNGQKTVYSWFKDTNNQISSSRSDTITLNEPPVDSIPSNNYIGVQGNGLKTERDIRIRIRATDDNGLVAHILSEDSTSPTSDSPQWIEIDGSPADFNQIVDFTITSNGNGQKTIYSWFKDTNNQISNSRSDTITLNEPSTDSPPNNKSLIIAGNATSVTTRNVVVSVEAEDDNGLKEYCLSEISGASTNECDWKSIPTSPRSESDDVAFQLTEGNGLKTVYSWFKDTSNQISNRLSDTVTLNEPVPSSPIVKVSIMGETTIDEGGDRFFTLNGIDSNNVIHELTGTWSGESEFAEVGVTGVVGTTNVCGSGHKFDLKATYNNISDTKEITIRNLGDSVTFDSETTAIGGTVGVASFHVTATYDGSFVNFDITKTKNGGGLEKSGSAYLRMFVGNYEYVTKHSTVYSALDTPKLQLNICDKNLLGRELRFNVVLQVDEDPENLLYIPFEDEFRFHISW